MQGIDRLNNLIRDIYLLNAIGEVITLQIDLLDVNDVIESLKEQFNDSEKDGLYINGMILQRKIAGSEPDYHDIFDKITDITGDFESIESVTVLIRVAYSNSNIEVTLQIDGQLQPNILQVANNQMYFDLTNLIQTKWVFAKSHMQQ